VELPKIDFHVHTAEKPTLTFIPLEGLIKEAEERCLKYLAVTDHWKDDTEVAIFVEERRKLGRLSPRLEVFLSAEVEIVDDKGSCPINPRKHYEVLEALDYLSAAPHLGELIPEGKRPKTSDKYIEYVHRKYISILENELFKVILHPDYGVRDGVKWGYFKTSSLKNIPEELLDEFCEVAASEDKVVEVNENTVNAVEDYDILVRKLVERGVKLTVGSDYHYFEQKDFPEYWVGRTQNALKTIIRNHGQKLLWIP